MKPKIHYHSHAAFFSGAENMLSVLLQSEELHSRFSNTFSYRFSHEYHNGFKKRVTNFKGEIFSLRFLHFYDREQLPSFLPNFFKRLLFLIFNIFLTYPLFFYQVIILYRLLLKVRPDILHINNAGYPAALSARAAAIAGRIAGVPKIIMIVNNLAVGYDRPYRWIEYPIDKIVSKSINFFITGSQSAAIRLQRVLKLESDKVTQIHNGIKLRKESETCLQTKQRLNLINFKGVIFGVVALLVPRKGHQILLDAINNLIVSEKFKGQDFMLLIEGKGPLHQELMDFVVNKDLSQWVTFIGQEDNIVNFMSAIDVLIWPSIEDEDFPNVISEAMGLGKPVIASRLAGTPEQVVEGITGLLIEPRDSEQLSRSISYLIKNTAIRKSMGIKAKERFKTHFSSEIAVKNYLDFYQTLIEV